MTDGDRVDNRWPTVEHALAYLERADRIPHRTEGEAVLLEHLPDRVERVLDLGTGDGRLLALVLTAHPDAEGVGVDFSEPMLAAARERFGADDRVTLHHHALDDPFADWGTFDAVVSSFAVHHVGDGQKRRVFADAFACLGPGGAFLNLEHVASPTPRLHDAFRVAIGERLDEPEDPANQLAPVADQLEWLRAVGFDDVDCHWKWLELALLAGVRPVLS